MVDLKALAGAKYRVTLDESAELDTDRASRLWYYRVPGKAVGKKPGLKSSFISVPGENMLAAWSDRPSVVKKLLAITAADGVRPHQQGDREVRILFTPDRLDELADAIEARRRRRLTEAQKAKAAANLKPFVRGWRSNSEAPSGDQGGGLIDWTSPDAEAQALQENGALQETR